MGHFTWFVRSDAVRCESSHDVPLQQRRARWFAGSARLSSTVAVKYLSDPTGLCSAVAVVPHLHAGNGSFFLRFVSWAVARHARNWLSNSITYSLPEIVRSRYSTVARYTSTEFSFSVDYFWIQQSTVVITSASFFDIFSTVAFASLLKWN